MSRSKEKKLLLRDWLEAHLDGNRLTGLAWENRAGGVFQMVWRHANNPTWSEEDGMIYREWALHKQHYRPNSDGTWPEPDYPTWKARFRCAMKRCRDVEELEVNRRPGEEKTEWKRFRLFPKKERSKRPAFPLPHIQPNTNTLPVHTAVPTTVTCTTDVYNRVAFAAPSELEKIPSNLPSVLSCYQGTPPSSVQTGNVNSGQGQQDSSGLMALSSGDLLQMDPGLLLQYGEVLGMMDIGESMKVDTASGQFEMPNSVSLLSFKTPPAERDMCLWLRFRSTIIGKHYVINDNGCRIFNPELQNIPPLQEMYQNGSHICFPDPSVFLQGPEDAIHLQHTKALLDYIDNGVYISSDMEGNIFATRLSRCRIYYAGPASNAAEPQPLPRKEQVKVFDGPDFMKRFSEYQENKKGATAPSVSVLFSFGEQWSLTKPISKNLISATVINARCWHELQKYQASRNSSEKMVLKELNSDCEKMSIDDAIQESAPIKQAADMEVANYTTV